MTFEPSLSYWTVQPSGETFTSTKIRNWVEQNLHGRVLNTCAGTTKLKHRDIIRNDINPTHDADLHHDVAELGEVLEDKSFDVIIYDPPYSEHQAKETYGIADGLPDPEAVASSLDSLLKPSGTIIQWGFSTTPLPLFNGYRTNKVAIWNLLGRQFDWFASIIQKTPDSSRHTTRIDSKARVKANEGQYRTLTDGGASTTTSGIDLSYHQLPRTANRETAVHNHLSNILSGYTLDVSPKSRSLSHDDVLVSVSETTKHDADFHLDERTLSDQFANRVFDSIVVDLPVSAFQSNRRYGQSTTGRDTALKQEIDPLVADSGQVIQVGHTATLMPATLKYMRERVAIFAHPTADRDLIVTTDMRPDPIEQLNGQDKHPTDIDYENTTATPRYICQRCLEGTYLDPAWYVDCPECGAYSGNYCWENDEVRPVPHESRIHQHATIHEEHGCPVDLDAVSPPFIETEENRQIQTPISEF